MAGLVRILLNLDWRNFARLVIPKDLRSFMDGETELRQALGPDYRVPKRPAQRAPAIFLLKSSSTPE